MAGAPSDASYATVRRTRVRFLDEGQGPAVVLVHGFASSLETWAPVKPALLDAGFRVLAMDLKGFGWTGRPEGDYSPEEQARIILELMDRRGVERAAVVGHSYGSSVALALALQAPGRVSRIALYDAWVYEEQLPTFFHWARARGIGELLFALYYDQRPADRIALAFYDPETLTQSLVDEVEQAMERPGTQAAALAAVRGMHYEKLAARYPDIEQPTLLLWGREDRVSSKDVGERLARDMPRAELIVYPRCGHFPMIEARRASNRDLLAFLGGEVAGPGVERPKPAPAPETTTPAPGEEDRWDPPPPANAPVVPQPAIEPEEVAP
jgi:pimeloyl-ACP methyl ester carboxylesterase